MKKEQTTKAHRLNNQYFDVIQFEKYNRSIHQRYNLIVSFIVTFTPRNFEIETWNIIVDNARFCLYYYYYYYTIFEEILRKGNGLFARYE